MPELWTEEAERRARELEKAVERANIEALFYTVLGSLLLGFLILLAATYYSSPSHHL